VSENITLTKTQAAACDVNLHLFDVETQSQTARFTGHTAAVKSLALDPNNECEYQIHMRRVRLDIDPYVVMMASGSRDGNICIWDRRLHPGAHDGELLTVSMRMSADALCSSERTSSFLHQTSS
jgi:WD40 repeat protein